MQPEPCHCPLIFRMIQIVYCRPPDHPGGVTSGHDPCLSNTRCAPLGIRSRRCSVVVTGQEVGFGELCTMTVFRLIASFGAGPVGVDGPGLYTGAGSDSIWNACVYDHGTTVDA